ncbi:MAG: hypothetical protein HY808_01115 [Nitrospirae bacterium]|nr:hypothetical protein [Nitrospirota bacterium]
MKTSAENNNKIKINIILYALPAVIIFTIIYLIRGIAFQDDAFIYYRYASNWAAGYGPVFNIGEHVEAYSNLFWVAIIAFGGRFYDIATFAPYLNLFIGIICLFFISYLSGFLKFSYPRLMAIVLPVFCALSNDFYYYGATGMDTLASSFALLLCIIIMYKCKGNGKYTAVALLSLLVMLFARTEGFLYVIAWLSILAYFEYSENKKLPNSLSAVIIISIISIATYFLVRHSIYNLWTSSPITAKGYASHLCKRIIFAGDFSSIKELIRVILSGLNYYAFFFYLGAWIPFIVLFFQKKNKENILLCLFSASLAINVFISVWAGGDYMPFARRFVPVLPIMIIYAAWAMDTLIRKYWEKGGYRKYSVLVISVILFISWSVHFMSINPPSSPFRTRGVYTTDTEQYKYLREIGLMLRDAPAPTTILSQMQGRMSYYAGPKVYVRDILGITNYHNAKYGEYAFAFEGKGGCGRTDFNYSFNTPFDIFFYNSTNMHNRFIDFCNESPGVCDRYRFFKSAQWPDSFFYIIANIDHPVSTMMKERYNTDSFPINESLRSIIHADEKVLIDSLKIQ